MQLAGMAGFEWVIIVVVIIALFFGVKKIPELARSFARASGEYEKAKIEMRKEVESVKATGVGEREKLESVATKLGIDYADKTDDELRQAIAKSVEKKPE
ncbi:MAG TPA: twin-arginine translocase TatA/TatE family subunit [Nitrososphaeraceae archaeon]|nr:twin-arginine translocase TatA/TatE family subunit [Nitrososphaeraceae archaeon]